MQARRRDYGRKLVERGASVSAVREENSKKRTSAKHGEDSAEHRPEEVVACEHRSDVLRVTVRQVAANHLPSGSSSSSTSYEDAYFKPAWKSRNVPLEKIAEPMTGTIQWMLADDVQPNQNMEMGRRIPPTIAIGRRFSGMKSAERAGLVSHFALRHGRRNAYSEHHWRTLV